MLVTWIQKKRSKTWINRCNRCNQETIAPAGTMDRCKAIRVERMPWCHKKHLILRILLSRWKLFQKWMCELQYHKFLECIHPIAIVMCSLINFNSGQIMWSANCNWDAASPHLNISSALLPPDQWGQSSYLKWFQPNSYLQVTHPCWGIQWFVSILSTQSCQVEKKSLQLFLRWYIYIYSPEKATSSCFIQSKNLVTDGDVASSLDEKFHNLPANQAFLPAEQHPSILHGIKKVKTMGKK